ncbi:hypothetical protein ES708_23375 [subsurface metagenome]
MLDSYPIQLSGGMRQRVCIAFAIATARDLLIADEPTTNLDVTIQDQVLRLIRDLVEKKRASLILITHSLELVGLTALFIIVAGISLGVISARYANTWFDNVVRLFSYLGIVTPAFAWAVILMLLFGFVWHIFPTYGRLTEGVIPPSTITGMYTVDSLLNGQLALFWDAFVHLILPAIALALPPMSQAARITRSSMADNQNKDCISSMIAYGVPNRVVVGKYLLKPSLISPITVMALDIAATFGYAFMVEKIFGFPGLARYGIQVMLNKDVNAIVGVVMVLGVVFITLNIVVDIIVAYLDPRIRLLGRSV